MQRRALILGSEIEGLKGVKRDTREMARLLGERHFDVEIRTDALATRSGILAAYDELIDASQEGDVAVVYYSGHGSFGWLPNGPRSWQCICPTDYLESTDADWRGITAWELSIKQAELTQKTRNVTVILDCCHSAQMSRDAAALGAVPRALPHPVGRGFEAHLRTLEEKYGDAYRAVRAEGNQDAVRLVACGQNESAYEYTGDGDEPRGAFTEAVIAVLEDAGGAPITWETVAEVVRARVLRLFALQRPDVEGPLRRQVFDLVEDDGRGLVRVRAVVGGYQLPTGKLAGDNIGDLYAVLPAGSTVHDPKTEVVRLEVTEVQPAASFVKPTAEATLPDAALAVPVKRNGVKRPVRIEAPAAERAALVAAVEASTLLRAAGAEDAPLATLRLTDDKLTIEDMAGPLFEPTRFPDELAGTVRNLAAIATAQGIRELAGEHEVYAREVDIELGLVEDGKPHPLLDQAPAIGLGDKLYVKVTSKAKRDLFVHVFNIGLRGKVTLLTGYATAGIRIRPGDSCVLGENDKGELEGLELVWPAGLPTTMPRLEECAVFVTSSQVNLRSLETTTFVGTTRGASASMLEQLVAQLQDGLTRDAAPKAKVDGFYMKRITWLLHPRRAALGDITFEIDETPLGAATNAREAWHVARAPIAKSLPTDVPKAITIQLERLRIEKNRALFGSADIRVDALVCTRSVTGGPVAWSDTWARVRDGDDLPLPGVSVFQGEVRDFVDIRLFVSRDDGKDVKLSKLLEERTNSVEFQDAAGALLLTAGIVSGGPWVAALGASAVLGRMAYELVREIGGASIGLYRTTFLRKDRFGIGRHPVDALFRAQDFSFALQVTEVST